MKNTYISKATAIIMALVIMITAVPFAAVAAESDQDLVWTDVSAGRSHSVAIMSDGTVWAWGGNSSGQLGDGTTYNRHTPAQVSGLTEITAISAGGYHTTALKSDGTVWAWGGNTSGQLGDGTTTNRRTPAQVSGLTGVIAISAGNYHTIALKSDGTVWSWGVNQYGQLGDGTTTDRHTPVRVSGLTGVTAIYAGYQHTAALKSDGTVWAWGWNHHGQHGDGTNTTRYTPVRVSGLTGVTAISAGYGHTTALKSDGTVWTWGYNYYGQLGDDTTTNRHTPVQVSGLTDVTAISAGNYRTTALKSDGTVWSWGDNEYGQLGDGTATHRHTPVRASNFTGVTAISAGYYHTVAIKSDGTVWAWGWNFSGQLGDGTTTNRGFPVKIQIITITSVTISPSESIVRQGDTQQFTTQVTGIDDPPNTVTWSVEGRTSNNTTISRSGLLTVAPNERATTLTIRGVSTVNTGIFATATVTLPTITEVKVSPEESGLLHGESQQFTVDVIGLFNPDRTVIWSVTGKTSNYTTISQDGLLTIAPNERSTALTVRATPTINTSISGTATVTLPTAESEQDLVCIDVSAGGYHTVALLSDGTVYAWGRNDRGQLGDGTTTDRHIPVRVSGLTNVTAISAGYEHTVALKSDGTVWAWGLNFYGQLGDGTTTTRRTPVQVSGLTGITAISAGYSHTIALKSDGTVWAWGNNGNGRLGDGTTTNRHTPVQVSGLTGITAISAGEYHTVALKSDGKVWSWGVNWYGQLGDGTTSNSRTPVQVSGLTEVTAISAGRLHTTALKSDGTVWAWGRNDRGQIGDGTTTDRHAPVRVSGLTEITAISAGEEHTVALKSDGTVWAWGNNGNGRLGDGTTTTRSTPVQVSDLTTEFTAISAGTYHTIALRFDGTVWAWGYNNRGQLGDGTTTTRRTPVKTQSAVAAIQITFKESSVFSGESQQFTARVIGINDPDRTVTWSVTGRTSNGTTISQDGLLTVSKDERAATLTIRATSTVNTTVSGTAAMGVHFVIETTVSPTAAIVQKGSSRQFSASVVALLTDPPQDVTWIIEGSSNSGTTISAVGLLTVAANETADVLLIWAVSTKGGGEPGMATVHLTAPPFPGYIKGNPTKTGTVTVRDILTTRDHILGTNRLTDPGALWAADANDDGVINIFDMLVMRDVILRK